MWPDQVSNQGPLTYETGVSHTKFRFPRPRSRSRLTVRSLSLTDRVSVITQNLYWKFNQTT